MACFFFFNFLEFDEYHDYQFFFQTCKVAIYPFRVVYFQRLLHTPKLHFNGILSILYGYWLFSTIMLSWLVLRINELMVKSTMKMTAMTQIFQNGLLFFFL